MAVATFHSVRGQKSALIMVKANVLEFGSSPVYVPRAGVEHFTGKSIEELEKGDTFDIPDGYTLVDIVDIETGEIITTKGDNPVAIKQLKY